jgi:antitoxin HigA-1
VADERLEVAPIARMHEDPALSPLARRKLDLLHGVSSLSDLAGEILAQEFLDPMGLTQAEAARRMGVSTNRLNELVRGNRGVTAATAIRLASLLGTSPELWLNLQATWDLWQAYRLEGRRGAA